MSEYITKDAVFDLLHGQDELILFTRSYKENGSVGERLCNAITRIPAADVEPVVRGEWTMLTADLTDWSRETYVNWLKCSLCGKAVPLRSKSKFCPHCGAHMVERQCAMPFKTQSVEEEKKACADYFERAERSGSGE